MKPGHPVHAPPRHRQPGTVAAPSTAIGSHELPVHEQPVSLATGWDRHCCRLKSQETRKGAGGLTQQGAGCCLHRGKPICHAWALTWHGVAQHGTAWRGDAPLRVGGSGAGGDVCDGRGYGGEWPPLPAPGRSCLLPGAACQLLDQPGSTAAAPHGTQPPLGCLPPPSRICHLRSHRDGSQNRSCESQQPSSPRHSGAAGLAQAARGRHRPAASAGNTAHPPPGQPLQRAVSARPWPPALAPPPRC